MHDALGYFLNIAADFARFINPTLVLIVSFIEIYTASVAFMCVFVLHEPSPYSNLASDKFGPKK